MRKGSKLAHPIRNTLASRADDPGLASPGLATAQKPPGANWPTIQGTVMGATVSAQHGLIPTYRIRISYTYIVNGEYYAGSNKTIFLRKSSAETMASGLKGRTVMLRYPSSEPARSALLQRDQFGWPN